jgi:hypothetical protein
MDSPAALQTDLPMPSPSDLSAPFEQSHLHCHKHPLQGGYGQVGATELHCYQGSFDHNRAMQIWMRAQR